MTDPDSRYFIYHLIGKKVEIETSDVRRRAAGLVRQVYRNIMENRVEITIGSRLHCFEEPQVISRDNDCVMFLYGRDESFEDTDEAVFTEARLTGESIPEVLERTAPAIRKRVRFSFIEDTQSVS